MMDWFVSIAPWFLGGLAISIIVFGYLFLTNFDRIIDFIDKKNKR